MHPVMERSAERKARNDRTFPTVPGQNAGRLSAEMSTGPQRLSAKAKHNPHAATSAKRFGVKPSNGRVSDLYAGQALDGQDDGSGYFDEFRETGGINPLPAAKTRSQDALRAICVAWIAGEREDWMRDLIKDGIAKISEQDSETASAYRIAMIGRGIWS